MVINGSLFNQIIGSALIAAPSQKSNMPQNSMILINTTFMSCVSDATRTTLLGGIGQLTIDHVLFIDNRALIGAALTLNDVRKTSIMNTQFQDNLGDGHALVISNKVIPHTWLYIDTLSNNIGCNANQVAVMIDGYIPYLFPNNTNVWKCPLGQLISLL
jgi:hypothetical protein